MLSSSIFLKELVSSLLLPPLLVALVATRASAADAKPSHLPGVPPVVVQAESGQLGADQLKKSSNGLSWITIRGTGGESSPQHSRRVATYRIRFPKAGEYELYARLRVGPKGVADDSFFFARAFGDKDPAEDSDWTVANGLGQVGYSEARQIVSRGGAPVEGEWHWIHLSSLAASPELLTYRVPAGDLTQTFQIAGREDGLDIDQLAFGPAGISHSVAQLEGRLPGRYIPPVAPPAPFLPIGPALATGKKKYLGGVHSASQLVNFKAYFNQVTPENAGKWGSVEAVRDVMVWDALDAAYRFAKANGFPIRMHVMVWGNQQPAWIESLPPAEQRAEIEQWFGAVAARYPDLDYVEVVNEPLHDPPNQRGKGGGNYIEALGGAGKTGWDWIVTSFRLARWHFPKAKLVLNDYSIVDNPSDTERYRAIVDLLKSESLIDAVGVQCHGFSTKGPLNVMAKNLDRLALSGLPLLVTELDIDGDSDAAHLAAFQRFFPLLWEHPAVQGITFWGYRPGMWRTPHGAYLAHDNGAERPSLQWLRGYVQNDRPSVIAGQRFVLPESTVPGSTIGRVQGKDVQATPLRDFEIVGGNGAPHFVIEPETGRLSLRPLHSLDFEATRRYQLNVTVRDEYSQSAPGVVTIDIRNTNDSLPAVVPLQVFHLENLRAGVLGQVRASDPDDIGQPGFSALGGFQITGGSGLGLFRIEPNTGVLSLPNPEALDFSQSRYRLEIVVRDGQHSSEPNGVEIRLGAELKVCQKGHSRTVPREKVWRSLRRGARLGACPRVNWGRSPLHPKSTLRRPAVFR